MTTTPYFLTLNLDDDDLVESQAALSQAEVLTSIDAAPAGLGYVVCGTGANVEAGSVPLDTWGSSDLTMNSNIFYLSGLEAKDIKTTTFHSNSLRVSAVDLIVSSAVVTLDGGECPIPLPFGYVQCDDAGTDSTDEQNFGLGATITAIESNTDDIEWDDTNKYFVVAKAGTYELLANLVLDSGSQNDILTIKAKVNGSAGVTILPRIYGNVGPVERTFQCVLTATAGQNVTISIEMGSTKTVHLETGSTFRIGRLK